MYNIYVPYEDISSNVCYSFNDTGDILYAFTEMPIEDIIVNADAVYLNNHYSIVNGNYKVNNINCISENNLTNEWLYRKDLPDIFISLFFIAGFVFGIPLILFSKFFKRRLFL